MRLISAPIITQGFWSNPNTPQWGLVIVAVIAASFAFMAFTASKRQAKAAEKMLLLTHRPKIIVRNVVVHGLENLNRTSPMINWTTDLTGYYFVANTGGVPAEVLKLIEGTWIDKALPMERPDKDAAGRKVSIHLKPGESREINFKHIEIKVDDAMALINGKSVAYFLTRIIYTDSDGIQRETGACRKFDPTAKYFVRVRNQDYEYAD